ncbi:MAG: U32 family peptidase [Clostridia bacterium]|nr:U32 family peptidase [Clostridia bacterium]
MKLFRHGNPTEVLSPCGEWESFRTALQFGADAVYLGGKEFGMRTASKNFDSEQIKACVRQAHLQGVKVYVTCNTVPDSKEIVRLPEHFAMLENAEVDAVIVADIGVMDLAKKYAPHTDIHMSTQTGIMNYHTANVLYNMGAKRVVLARELTFEDIAEIRAKVPKELEIECFVQGAMCVSFSGRCLISAYMTGRDANRGDCTQPCRWKYHLFEQNREGQYFPVEEDSDGTYLYNSKDMCMIDHIPELIECGITSLKIEGRAKSAYYTAVTTYAYRNAVDLYYQDPKNYILPDYLKEELNKISHRQYSTGFFLGNEPGQVHDNGGYIREYDVVAMCDGYENGIACLTQKNKFLVGDTLDVLPPSGKSFTFTVTEIINHLGESVNSAPHAMEKLTVPCDIPIPQGSFIRRKHNN